MGGNFRQFGKRYAIRIDDFERSIISHSLTKEELRKAFDMMDRNNDGLIDVRELARLFVYDPRACEEFVRRIIDTVDIDENGKLSFSEFIILMVRTDGMDGVKAAFQSYDTNDSKAISIEELARWMERHGKKMSEEELCKVIDVFDVNGDNRIDYDEFLLLVCRRILRDRAIAVEIDLSTGRELTQQEKDSLSM